MVDLVSSASSSSRYAGVTSNQKRRLSSHGITKSHKSHLLPPCGIARKSPRCAKTALIQQRQREAAAQAIRRAGILNESEYRDEVRRYMHEMEEFTMSCAQSMDQQPEISWNMRPCLVDFLMEVHFTFRLRPETLYLTLNIVDRYVSRRVVYMKHYQLVGCAALWVAAKFEDAKDRVPTIQDLTQMCQNEYEESAFVHMEAHILSTLQWTLGHPTAEAWLRLMCCGGPYQEDGKVQHVARFLMEVTLFYREFVTFAPSVIALASLTLARYLCHKARRPWEETDECLEVVALIDKRLATHVNELSETLVRKYSYAFYSKAATFVVQCYLKGMRFQEQTFALPGTPSRSKSPTRSSTSSPMSESSDDMPQTPSTPASLVPNDVFKDASNKENLPSSYEPSFTKPRYEAPEQYLPQDYLAYGRPALHNLNVSPRAMQL